MLGFALSPRGTWLRVKLSRWGALEQEPAGYLCCREQQVKLGPVWEFSTAHTLAGSTHRLCRAPGASGRERPVQLFRRCRLPDKDPPTRVQLRCSRSAHRRLQCMGDPWREHVTPVRRDSGPPWQWKALLPSQLVMG
ncbi:unnamed protein product [Caretta caretta]